MTTAISNLSATWSNSSIAYNAISMNVTNTGANNQSTLLNFAVNGNNVFRISGDGKLRIGAANNFTVANPSVSGGAYAERVFNIVDRGPTLKIAAIDSDTGIELVRYNTEANAVTTFMAVYGVANSLIIQDRTTGPAYTLMNVTNTLITFSRDTNISGNLTANVINATNILINGADIASALNPTPNIQTFTTGGTWTRPNGSWSKVIIKLWGAGGAGANATTSESGGGGGGGAGLEKEFLYYELGDTGTVTIGVGGQTSSANGGNSSFSSNGIILNAYGGAGGLRQTYYGGGGGGLYGSGTQPVGGRGGGGDGGDDEGATTARFLAIDSIYGGAGGGATPNVTTTGGTTTGLGASSVFGGGGGGAGNTGGSIALTIRLGGSSLFGGAGGNGAINTLNAQPGFFPGGGGGGGASASAARTIFGKGANGYCVVITY